MTHQVKYDFSGRVALVTGGASGMGYAAARNYAEAGASVVVSDNRRDAMDQAVEALRAEGADVTGVPCDVSNEEQVKNLVEEAVHRFGRLDFAYNNAGIQTDATPLEELSTDLLDQVLQINLRGVLLCMKYELSHMVPAGRGSIVNCSSLGGFVGVPGRAAYHAAKHGIHGATKSAALERAADGIRINAVCPGIVDTRMVADMKDNEPEVMDEMIQTVPARRLGTAEEIAAAVMWLSSDASSFVTGHALAVDGGYTVQ
ncbi:short-chain dehydrogenase/reductase SDR [Roseivivax marinus]|uniref:Short-chain dehydrogenase/reductase SDR n=1 Tax=Roseivivax marinus TaxID=1379903 RepID=W4HFQ3_9RHOB|nr:glucose 1-dehydrogenase [Roseivivax marinus]ETW11592.1 short-chain dehydrogenase/reductase SDR [Roseivivax marinus]